ncbi:endoplasmic reticulum-Golgi intermediate compartment protein 1-like [Styela clava]|uniref:endoplasmic reticulum-Golgi intermediate compartment protein 1-like n=1 Tax=Styela clava TaxID=7725 RepID=UPI001939F4CB|nr:endoplasmic reticulum-Golgi intermediate compartment protein 1-like [Styela clava]
MVFDFRRFDVYRKVPKDLTQPTTAGAAISIACSLFIFFLFISELASFITVDVVSELYVDDPQSGDRIPVYLDISLPGMACEYVGLDIQDEMGRHEVGLVDNTNKVPINEGAGCLFTTSFHINKVPGNFHVSTHSAPSQPPNPDMTHEIRELRFGDRIMSNNIKNAALNSLSGKKTLEKHALSSHDYVMKIVPTVHENINGDMQYAYQYTSAYKDYISYGHGHRILPAIWFKYELTPITVKYTEKRQPFYHFITMVCAIIGGTFTVAGIVDSFVFSATEMYKKFALGKLS